MELWARKLKKVHLSIILCMILQLITASNKQLKSVDYTIKVQSQRIQNMMHSKLRCRNKRFRIRQCFKTILNSIKDLSTPISYKRVTTNIAQQKNNQQNKALLIQRKRVTQKETHTKKIREGQYINPMSILSQKGGTQREGIIHQINL